MYKYDNQEMIPPINTSMPNHQDKDSNGERTIQETHRDQVNMQEKDWQSLETEILTKLYSDICDYFYHIYLYLYFDI